MDPGVHKPHAKRRKLRKGTRSCWECKGRKVRCTYMTDKDTVCDGCSRRGTRCISQELPEQPLAQLDRRKQMANRMVRVETLIEKLVKGVGEGSATSTTPSTSIAEPSASAFPGVQVSAPSSAEATPNYGAIPSTGAEVVDCLSSPEPMLLPAEPLSKDSPLLSDNSVLNPLTRTGNGSNERLETVHSAHLKKLSKTLLAVFPNQEDVELVVKMAGPIPPFFHQLLRTPFKDLQISEKEKYHYLDELTTRHTPRTHPLIIARQMLLLAISFRYIHPDSYENIEGFSEPPGAIMQRIAYAAIEFLGTEDNMLESAEGLECLMLTCTFQADSGDLRSSWTSIRRAMLKAQLMCLQRQQRHQLVTVQPVHQWDPQYLWHRILYCDRFYSLLLGLPQGSTDISLGTEPPLEEDTPIGRLQRRHCSLAGRILRQNEPDSNDDAIIDAKATDAELRKLSESMPSKWWLIPNLALINDSEHLFWETAKLHGQTFHYILLSHLHISSMLRSSSGQEQHWFEYSQVTCINASRDLLHRYRAFRSFRRGSYCCHGMDFFAIMASMTLILVHLDAHHSKRNLDKALSHQRVSDRAMMEEILDNMEQIDRLNNTKTVIDKGAGILRRLLVIEADAAAFAIYRLEVGDVHSNHARALCLNIPYLGVITIVQDDKASPAAQEQSIRNSGYESTSPGNRLPELSSHDRPPTSLSLEDSNNLIGQRQQQHELNPMVREGGVQLPTPAMTTMQTVGDDIIDGGEFTDARSSGPDLATGNGWALPGRDELGFFDSIIEDSESYADFIGDFWWLSEDFP